MLEVLIWLGMAVFCAVTVAILAGCAKLMEK